jgi:hypothetical protein
MENLYHFHNLLILLNQKRYTYPDDHEYIKTFATTTNSTDLRKTFLKNKVKLDLFYDTLPLYCSYVADSNYFDPNMFNCFITLEKGKILVHCAHILIKSGNMDIVATYFKQFSNKMINKLDPYCKKNTDITKFLIDNYHKLISYKDLLNSIIFEGDIVMYHTYKHYIGPIITDLYYTLRTQSVEMFNLVCRDFPNCLNGTIDTCTLNLRDNSVIETLLTVARVYESPSTLSIYYIDYPNYKDQIFALLIKIDFVSLFYAACTKYEKPNAQVCWTALVHVINNMSKDDLINSINSILYDNVDDMGVYSSKTQSRFFNMLKTSEIHAMKIEQITQIFHETINKYSVSTLFYMIDWSNHVQCVYKHYFDMKTQYYNTRDFIELIYFAKRVANNQSKSTYCTHSIANMSFKLYMFYVDCKILDVKSMIETIFRSMSFDQLFYIICKYRLEDDNIICQIAETKFSQLNKYNLFALLRVVNKFLYTFF